ncbi:hypothetical protein FRX31_019408 [Thalictrum thalictroides]|uniref:SAWADEE domain-containing protein n=1 Tax=Thalictrum thalictroides TaxID=46969 RepID=A0A7J6W3V0_THATH|nr:hypothetical protein FRX31_019408 [Thalictrum thalictroides]
MDTPVVVRSTADSVVAQLEPNLYTWDLDTLQARFSEQLRISQGLRRAAYDYSRMMYQELETEREMQRLFVNVGAGTSSYDSNTEAHCLMMIDVLISDISTYIRLRVLRIPRNWRVSQGDFPPPAIQLQDNQCQKVVQGMTICASYVDGNDVKYYDAVVESVTFKDHKFKNEEVCTCTFGIIWLNGLKIAGNRTDIVAAHIYLLQPERTPKNRTLSSSLKISRDKLNVDSGRSGSSYYQDTDL